MVKVKEFFIDFMKTRKVTYYVAFGVAVLAFITGIVATAGLSAAGATALPLVFTLLGLAAFLGFSIIGQEKFGSGTVAFASFGSLVVLICEVFEYFLTEIQGQAMVGIDLGSIKGLTTLIVCAVLFVLCSVVNGVFAWLKLRKDKSCGKMSDDKKDKSEGREDEN